MKEKLKYIEAILLACSIGLLFMPFIKISVLEFSVMDILKTGLGNFNTSETQSDISDYSKISEAVCLCNDRISFDDIAGSASDSTSKWKNSLYCSNCQQYCK